MTAKHGDKAARTFTAKVEGDDGDGIAAGQSLQREAHMQLLPPSTERHAGLSLEQAGKGSLARAYTRAPFLDREACRRVCQHRVC